jgi:hypothetical protein
MAKATKQAALNVLEPERRAAVLEAARKANRRDNAVTVATYQLKRYSSW